MSQKKTTLFPILLVNFLATFGFSVVLPFLVFLVTKSGGNALVYGILGAVYPAFQLIGAPVLGKWSDIYGRKKILLLCEIGSAIGWGIFLISLFLPNTVLIDADLFLLGQIIITLPITIIFLARAVDGLTGGNISVANAYIADITIEKDRNKNFGKMAISQGLGFIAGPSLAGILGGTAYGEILPVLLALQLSIAATLIIIFFLPDSKPLIYRENQPSTLVSKTLSFESKECFEFEGEIQSPQKVSFRKILTLKYIPYFIFLNFLIFLGFNFFYTAFPVHVVQKLGWSVTQMGIFFSILSGMMVLVQGPVLSFASGKYSDKTLVVTGSILLATNFILLLSGNIIILYLASVLFALGNGLMWPSFLSLLSKTSGKKYQGVIQGFSSSAGSLASIVGLIAGGILYTSFGASVFLVSAVIIYGVSILALRLPSK